MLIKRLFYKKNQKHLFDVQAGDLSIKMLYYNGIYLLKNTQESFIL